MSHNQSFETLEMDYSSSDNFRRSSRVKTSKSSRPAHTRRRGKTPQSVNGIHRRRRRKMAW